MRTAAQLRSKGTRRSTNARLRSPVRLLYLMETWALSMIPRRRNWRASPLSRASLLRFNCEIRRPGYPVHRVPNDIEQPRTNHLSRWNLVLPLPPRLCSAVVSIQSERLEQMFPFFLFFLIGNGDYNVTRPLLSRRSWRKTRNKGLSNRRIVYTRIPDNRKGHTEWTRLESPGVRGGGFTR